MPWRRRLAPWALGVSTSPDSKTIRNGNNPNTSSLPSWFQLPRIAMRSGNSPPQKSKRQSCPCFNFPGWNDHPEPGRPVRPAGPRAVSTSPDSKAIRNPHGKTANDQIALVVSTSPDSRAIRNLVNQSVQVGERQEDVSTSRDSRAIRNSVMAVCSHRARQFQLPRIAEPSGTFPPWLRHVMATTKVSTSPDSRAIRNSGKP